MAIVNDISSGQKRYTDSISEGNDILAKKEKQNKVEKGTAPVEEKKKYSLLDAIFVGKPEDVKNFLVHDILEPTIKNIVTGICDVIFYGPDGNKNDKSKTISRSGGYASCFKNGKSQNVEKEEKPKVPDSCRHRIGGYIVDDLTSDNKAEIEQWIDEANDEMDQCDGTLSVIQLYDIAGQVDGLDYTLNDWGWSNVVLSYDWIKKMNNGRYILQMPKIERLKGAVK